MKFAPFYALLLSVWLLGNLSAQVGSAFTYQGRLADGSAPIETEVDLRFSLWDAATTGSQIGSNLTFSNSSYDGGIVQLDLDFGTGAFNGDPRWLQIELASPTGSSYSTLNPRLEAQPAPYAIFAETATTLLSGVAANRAAIDSLPFEITTPGSYYLAASLSAAGGLTIRASNVTLDLNGFNITNTAGDGILIGAVTDVCIKNGFVTGSSADGIDASTASNVLIQKVKVIGNSLTGIRAGNEAIIEDCAVHENLQHGILVVDDCIVRNNILKRNSNANSERGINVTGDDNLIENNRVLNGRRGIQVVGTRNRLKGNFCKGSSVELTRSLANIVISADGNFLDLLIAEIPFQMTHSGKATVIGNLQIADDTDNGITIDADNVTIDLNGFEITGLGEGGTTGTYSGTLSLADPPLTSGRTFNVSGIRIDGQYGDIIVRNGSIRNWGSSGIEGISRVSNSLFEDLFLTGNDGDGLSVEGGNIVRNCIARLNGGRGFYSGGGNSFTNCIAEYNGGNGFESLDSAVITECISSYNEVDGFSLRDGSKISNSSAFENLQDGFVVFDNALVLNCRSGDNGDNGFEGASGNTFKNCTAWNNTDRGFSLAGFNSSGNTILYCVAVDNDFGGFDVDNGSLIEYCFAWDNDNDSDDTTDADGEDFGFRIESGTTIRNCVAASHGEIGGIGYAEDVDGSGILCIGSNSLIEENFVNLNLNGVRISSTDNFALRNVATFNTNNYNIDAGNAFGPTINLGNGSITGTSGSNNAWANFEF
jgi:parallel beta-helix repeat protein